ncbi:MAG: hypothetical protein Gaeavirus13_6 [Gaeavirus sp.]|uniref:MORN repeat-containing protein n=1 Tax=Gaeavirus sp. TaxID=2487767 RepID=A0A3G5A0Y9_9VIRU|nr:MAG: hypothetical protein Gaeavirus13_6 [Gaeavirus sp.]
MQVSHGETIDKTVSLYSEIGQYLKDKLKTIKYDKVNVNNNKFVIKYIETGTIKCIIDCIDDKFVGQCTIYNRLGHISCEGYLHDNSPIGTWNLWNNVSTVNCKLNFNDKGQYNGLQIISRMTDNISTFITMINDVPHGPFVQFISAISFCKGQYINGKKQGIWHLQNPLSISKNIIPIMFKDDIEIQVPQAQESESESESLFNIMKNKLEDVDPIKFNICNEYFDTNASAMVIKPTDIQNNNKYIVYYAPDKIHIEIDYKSGKLEGSQRVYHESGKLHYEGQILNSKRVGTCTRYNPSGEKRCRTTFTSEGIMTGRQKLYTFSGNHYMFNTINGIKHGYAYYKMKHKQIIFKTFYDNGTLIGPSEIYITTPKPKPKP